MKKRLFYILISFLLLNSHAFGQDNPVAKNPIQGEKMEIKPFGEIDPNNVEEFYEGEITVKGDIIELDLNMEEFYEGTSSDKSNKIDKEALANIADYINNLESNLDKAMQLVATDYDLDEDSETARDYLSHHLDVLGKEELQALFGDKTVSKELFLSKLKVYRVGFYPEEDEDFVIIDIQFPRDITNYLMAVTLDSDFNLSFIGMDS